MKPSVFLLCILLALSAVGCGRASTPPSDEANFTAAAPSEQTPDLPSDEPDPQPPVHTPEPEPEPTEPEPEPTEPTEPKVDTPAPAPRDVLLCCATNGLNVRKGPGTSYGSWGTLDSADMVSPLSKEGSWYKVSYCGTVGYVSASYVRTQSFALAGATVEKVIEQGKKLLGVPYVYGAVRYHDGNGNRLPNFTTAKFDCSSLMQYIFKIGSGVNLAVTSRLQSTQGWAVSRKNVRRGDLMFFTNASRKNNTGLERIGHVALYLGDNYILHTASDHAVIEPISATRESYFICARRIVG